MKLNARKKNKLPIWGNSWCPALNVGRSKHRQQQKKTTSNEQFNAIRCANTARRLDEMLWRFECIHSGLVSAHQWWDQIFSTTEFDTIKQNGCAFSKVNQNQIQYRLWKNEFYLISIVLFIWYFDSYFHRISFDEKWIYFQQIANIYFQQLNILYCKNID